MPTLVELIAAKRDGAELADEDIARLITAHGTGELADYQMTALCMAIFFQGMTARETAALTMAMLHSGEVIDLADVPMAKVDKHSTGGVGDKVSLCLAPLVAASGVAVPMISGRGLGHTGGTLDKLEAIAGFDVAQDVASFRRIVAEVGVCMIGQTGMLAPADKRIYALRDVTATVEAIPLIVASILSKKLAEGIDGLVLDVKVGRGAFMKTERQARELAEALVSVGEAAGKQVRALLTDMAAPLGRCVGNAIETREAIEMLKGEGPDDLVAITLALGSEMLRVGGVVDTAEEGVERLRSAVETGKGAEVFQRMIEAQGGDPKVVDDPTRLPTTEHQVEVLSDQSGVVTAIDALEIGLTSVAMGAGRTRADQAVDHAVGIELCCERNEPMEAGQPLAVLHVHDPTDAEQPAPRVRQAFTIDGSAAGSDAAPPIVIGSVAKD
ncbi:MAG: thymidine phosphorylase [Deltaproteobacteria bacterium]|nr:thymidine phosphorylase [Deltaproteobacteria bacterium]